MALYKVEREDHDYDEVVSAVVRASSRFQARKLFKALAGEDGVEVGPVTVVLLEEAGKPEVLHTYVHHG